MTNQSRLTYAYYMAGNASKARDEVASHLLIHHSGPGIGGVGVGLRKENIEKGFKFTLRPLIDGKVSTPPLFVFHAAPRSRTNLKIPILQSRADRESRIA